jgi:hypothetical protein
VHGFWETVEIICPLFERYAMRSTTIERRKRSLSTLTIWTLVLVCLVELPAVTQERHNRTVGELNRAQVEQLRRTKGIRAVADLVGSYKGAVKIDIDVVAMDLPTIADRSDAVIRGTVASQRSSISADGTWVQTDYGFRVSESFKGSLRADEVVVVRLPLGRVEFGGGAFAEVSDVQFEGFKQEEDYILFLSRGRDGQQVPSSLFGLAWGTQGAFELARTGRVRPLGSPHAPVPQAYATTTTRTLVTETKAAVAAAAKFRAGRVGKH